MSNPVYRFLKFVVGSRLAQFLFLVHLVLVICAVYPLPLADSDSWSFGGGCHGVPIAGRVLFYCDATGLLGTIATLDTVAVVLFASFATWFPLVAPLFWWIPELGFQGYSWTVAFVLLAVTSFQWLLIGACLEQLLRRFTRKAQL